MRVIRCLNEKGLQRLRSTLAGLNVGDDDPAILSVYAAHVEHAAFNRQEGESLSVELKGHRHLTGDTVHFACDASCFDWDENGDA